MVLGIIPQHLRKKFFVLTAIMAVGGLFEMAGVGTLLPVLAMMANPEAFQSNTYIKQLFQLSGQPEPGILMFIALAGFVMTNIFRVIFSLFSSWAQINFAERFVVWLSAKIYEGYINAPYSFHLERNSITLLRNITTEVNLVAAVLKNLLDIFSELLVMIAIGSLLCTVDTFGVLIVSMFLALTALFFHYITRNHIAYWGRQREYHENLRFLEVQQGLGGIKETKLLHLEDLKLRDYAPFNLGSARATQRNTFMQTLPRIWLELLITLGLGIYLILNAIEGKPIDILLPELGLFGAAAFRLMPSLNRILGSMHGIRFGTPAVKNLTAELALFDSFVQSQSVLRCHSNTEPLFFSDRIVARSLCYTYPTGHKRALDNISIEIIRGYSIGLVGGSGGGKSTLIDVMLGLLVPDSGELVMDGRSVFKNLGAWQRLLGYVPQSIYLNDDTIRRNVAFGLPEHLIDEMAVQRAVRLAQLETFANTLPLGLDTPVGERGVRLSGGQRQRIGIARALYYDPPILLLDEATSALDTETEQAIMWAVNALRGIKTLIIVAHRLTTVAQCDYIYRLENGRIVAQGIPSDVLDEKLCQMSIITC